MSDVGNADDIGFAALVFWDFVDESDENELLTTLTELYGAEPEEYGGPRLGGSGGWYHRVAGNQQNELEDSEPFESVRTLVQGKARGILDVTTYAILSQEQIQSLFTGENNRQIEKPQSQLSEPLAEIPTLVDHEETGHSGVYYAEWEGEEPLIPETEEIEKADIIDRLHEIGSSLSAFGFQTGGLLSLIRGGVFVCPRILMQPFDGLSAVRRDAHPDAEPFDELIFPPGWAAEFDSLRRYYRLKTWADSRWRKFHDFDEKASDARDELLALSSSQTDVDGVLPVSEQIQALQIEYTEFRTRFEAEYQALQDDLGGEVDENSTSEVPYDTAIAPSDSATLDTGDRSHSVIEYFESSAEQTFEQVDERREMVSNKIDSLVSSIESRTRLAATDENLTLQSRVTRLTWLLTVLTVVLVILTFVLVGIELL
ncbi:hypothetical protein ACFQL1_25580 [Halomicroarcula sp. GCM10025709]|uniref:hypothetical protein n=1 Tax=Haloarcula TaxID=2237 RepID=UPI0024C42262|nr:hypothetical protein [Halomicroarcula sp. YJ-61-S]